MKHNLGYFGKIVVTLQNISAGCALALLVWYKENIIKI